MSECFSEVEEAEILTDGTEMREDLPRAGVTLSLITVSRQTQSLQRELPALAQFICQ